MCPLHLIPFVGHWSSVPLHNPFLLCELKLWGTFFSRFQCLGWQSFWRVIQGALHFSVFDLFKDQHLRLQGVSSGTGMGTLSL